MKTDYDIIVVGGGHSGCEAAVAAAKLGSSVLLISMDMNKMAQMSCNPAIGGIAKGQIVREIDALGGYSAIVTDASTIQFRMLNKSKGPAMWSPRAQCDRMCFSLNWRYILENTCKLDIWQDIVTSLTLSGSSISGVRTSMGAIFNCKKLILTAGTFLNGKLFIGQETLDGGRISEMSSFFISDQLKEKGINTNRMKTGTPPRIDIRSVNLDSLQIQNGDLNPAKFSFLNYLSSIQSGVQQMHCYIGHTNSKVHTILKNAFPLSPLFSGKIHGIGPRYCPSIEDKLRTFEGKDEHQLFLEPEGWNTNEYYLQGFSSSLPLEVQTNALKEITSFENVRIFRPAYAVEYDFFDPTQLYASLESKVISNLFLAGQVNGTTGYEEAAAQGLMAGINASLSIQNKDPFILSRDQSYIGVLIDDLINKGVDEPYRMFTSRAEYRILLRQDDADLRLTPLSYNIGLASSDRMTLCENKYKVRDSFKKVFEDTKISPDLINPLLLSFDTSPVSSTYRLSTFVSRPQISIIDLMPLVPRGTSDSFDNSINCLADLSVSEVDLFYKLPFANNHNHSRDFLKDSIKSDILSSVEILFKYSGYIDRENRIALNLHKLESLSIPSNFDYDKVTSLSIESRQKLNKIKPVTIAQASRIPGVSPADISVLLVFFGRI